MLHPFSIERCFAVPRMPTARACQPAEFRRSAAQNGANARVLIREATSPSILSVPGRGSLVYNVRMLGKSAYRDNLPGATRTRPSIDRILLQLAHVSRPSRNTAIQCAVMASSNVREEFGRGYVRV